MPPQKKSATNAQNVGKQDKQDGKDEPHEERGGDPFTGGKEGRKKADAQCVTAGRVKRPHFQASFSPPGDNSASGLKIHTVAGQAYRPATGQDH